MPKPPHDPGMVFRLCISLVRKADLKRRFEGIEPLIVGAAAVYEAAGNNHEFYTIPLHDRVGDVTVAELKAIYRGRLAHQDGPGRAVYDVLRSSAPGGICPLCNLRDVGTLDHYLPQSLYPALAVNPANLVPTCFPCNDLKGYRWPNTPEEQMLHPYYDSAETGQWLSAEVVTTRPAALLFTVSPPDHWDTLTSVRVSAHFAQLQLATLYGSHAAVEIANIRGRLNSLFLAGGALAVREHLDGMAKSCKESNQQTWHAPAYRALADSDWFCNGGFAAT